MSDPVFPGTRVPDPRLLPADPGCSGPADTDEHNTAVACDDGIDNDGDGRVDFRPAVARTSPGDPGCSSLTDPSELAECDDGIDNDGDGRVDGTDPGCQGRTDNGETADTDRPGRPTGLACDDGIDNDGDGRADFRVDGSGDPGCSDPADRDEHAGPASGQVRSSARTPASAASSTPPSASLPPRPRRS